MAPAPRLTALAVLLASARAPHPWGQFGRSAAHASRGVSAGPTTSAPTVLWHTSPTSDDSAPIFVTAAVSSAGAVYFSQIDGCAASLDAATGAQRWSTCLPDRVSFFLGSPALSSDGSRVYFSTATNMSVLALDTSTGAIAWRFQGSLGSAFSGSPAVADDGSIFAGAEDGFLYVLSPAGALLWTYFCGVSIVSTPALGPTPPSAHYEVGVDGSAPGSSVFVASSAGTLTALGTVDAGSKALWSVTLWAQGGPLDWGWQSSPTVSDDGTLLYIGTWDGALLCLAADTGKVVWRFNASAALGIPAPYIISTPSLSVPGKGRALVYSGTVYHDDAAIDAYGTLFAVDAATGALAWQTHIATSLVTAPVVGTGGELYVSGYSGEGIPGGGVAAYDGASGARLWTKPLGESVYASPSMGVDGTLYVGGNMGEFFALAPYRPPTPLPSPAPSPAPSTAPGSGSAVATTIGLAVLGGFLVAVAAFIVWWGVRAWLRARLFKDPVGLDNAYAALQAL